MVLSPGLEEWGGRGGRGQHQARVLHLRGPGVWPFWPRCAQGLPTHHGELLGTKWYFVVNNQSKVIEETTMGWQLFNCCTPVCRPGKLAKRSHKPLPDFSMYFSRVEMCQWLRNFLAMQPIVFEARSVQRRLAQNSTTSSPFRSAGLSPRMQNRRVPLSLS